MSNINLCCSKKPIALECCGEKECRDCIEKIECHECGRIIYGSDEESIKDWNAGKNDE